MDRFERLKSLFKNTDSEAIVLTKPANIAAFFRGSQVSLGFRQEPPGRIAICIKANKVVLLGNKTEVNRIANDELSWCNDLKLQPFQWDMWNLNATVRSYLKNEGIRKIYDDIGIFGENIGTTLEGMYYPLNENEIIDLRQLAQEAAHIVESVARDIVSKKTETQVAGELAGQLISQSIWPELIMVAADDRIRKFQHCIPKDIPILHVALVSVTVHRRGLYISLTRLVSLGTVESEWRHIQEACTRVDANAILISKPGSPVGEIFKTIMRCYKEEGYIDEWRAHHQGGPSGFYGRDYKATENESRYLYEKQPVVWNPTIHGAKSEDTILTGLMGQQPEILTETGDWVYNEVHCNSQKVRRPLILEI